MKSLGILFFFFSNTQDNCCTIKKNKVLNCNGGVGQLGPHRPPPAPREVTENRLRFEVVGRTTPHLNSRCFTVTSKRNNQTPFELAAKRRSARLRRRIRAPSKSINSRKRPVANHLVGREQMQVPPQRRWARGRPFVAGDPERRDPGGRRVGARGHRSTRTGDGEEE